jgi:serine/threonine protein kinase/tetratricopeptide (TPR) repeat protein
MQALFEEALEHPAEQWATLLEARCGDDPTLRDDVLSMLQEDSRDDSLLSHDLAQVAHRVLGEDEWAGLPKELGPYRLLELLGAGGMGVVFLAERADLDSRVAIKVLRDAWFSPARRARFRSEQRTLARLNHPAIARLYDAGTLPDGVPWFAMEHVDGLPITRYCAEHAPTIREVLELFKSVCEAVLHAHQHAIIHRDLKPSNILVTHQGQVKLLDFGIAKPLDRDDTGNEPTRTALQLMTPTYAAPEQVRGGALGVQTDIYSLGVVLYELLTGRLPLELAGRTPAEIERMLAEQEPQKPSVAVREMVTADRFRNVRRAQWSDLDVLCLTALQKDPQRRYRTAESLIRDIDHYLRGDPLEARPDSISYRSGKFLRRHARAVSAAAVLLATVVGLVAFYTVRLATSRNEALAEAERRRRIQAFMANLFQGGDPEAGPSDSLRVVTLLDRGVREATALASDPALHAELYQTLGGIYNKLGNFDRADSLLSAALRERQLILPAGESGLAANLIELGLLRADQSKLDEAERLVRDGLGRSRRNAHLDPAGEARATAALGVVQEARGDYDGAIATLTRALQLDSAAELPPADVSATLTELANCHYYAGRYDVADSLNRRVLAVDMGLFGERHPHVASDLVNLGSIQQERGNYAEAEKSYRRALDIYRGWYGDEHFETAATLTMVARSLLSQKRPAEATELLQRALTIRERVYGKNHPNVATTLSELAGVARLEGRLDDAEADYRRVIEIYREAYHDHHEFIGVTLVNLGAVYSDRGDDRGAERMFRDGLAHYADTLPADHLYVGIVRIRLGRSLLRQHRYAEAERETHAGYEIVSRQSDPTVSWLKGARSDLAEAYDALGQPDQAARFRAEEQQVEKGEEASTATGER